MDANENTNGLGQDRDTSPKPIHRDELAYLIVAAGLGAYAQTGDIRGLYAAILIYALGNIAMRLMDQRMIGKGK